MSKQTFEEKLKELEDISAKIRDENLSLDDSIKSFETGMKIAKELDVELSSYEKRVKILLETKDGDYLEDFK